MSINTCSQQRDLQILGPSSRGVGQNDICIVGGLMSEKLVVHIMYQQTPFMDFFMNLPKWDFTFCNRHNKRDW